jgi:hypothetical protein
MNPALILIGTYILVVMVLQVMGFVISRGVHQIFPPVSLLVFLGLFMCSFGLAWPIAVRITQPKTAEGRLRNDLVVLRGAGTIGEFVIENRNGEPFLQISTGANSPTNLRHVVAEALGGAVLEARIVIARAP